MRMIHHLAAAVAMALLPLSATATFAETLVGNWEGRYSCDGRTEGRMQLDLSGEGGQIAGTFRFDHPEGAGAYHVIGREDGAGGFALAPQDWIERPAGMMALTLQGRFKAGGRAIEGALIGSHGQRFIEAPKDAAGRNICTSTGSSPLRTLPKSWGAGRRYYNEERPHGTIGNKVPIMLTKPGSVTSPSP